MRALSVAVVCLFAGTALADVTVNTTVDADVADAACSLREAIIAANTNADYHGCVRSAAAIDTIVFDVGTGTPTITITGTELPGLTEATSFDGNTGGATRVAIVNGGGLPTGLNYLSASNATDSVIRNLVISGFGSRELLLANGDGFVVEGNLLGTDTAGTTFAGSASSTGIEVCCGSGGNHIGGPTPAQRNVIVAGGTGISLGESSSNVVLGNFINTDVTGTQRLGGVFPSGVTISNAHFNAIGGPNAAEGNVIAGFNGIIIGGNPALTRSTGNVVQGNHIGADVTGTVALGSSSGGGVVLSHAVATQIGGLGAGEGNVISGNGEGVVGGSSGISGGSVDDTSVQGNLIGTTTDGTGALGNASFGVDLGDDAVIEGNVIAFNGSDGIEANCGACVQRISANAIHSNDGIGIDLNGGSNGVTANDDDDPDAGPNGRQNFPVLDAVTFAGGSTVSGTLNSTPSTTFRVEIFANDTCDPSGNGEGQEFVGFEDIVTTDAGGDAVFTVTLFQAVPAGKFMTATAIAPDGSTSEFSACPPPPTTTSTTSTSTTTSTTVTTTSTTSSTVLGTTTSTTTTSSITVPAPTTSTTPTPPSTTTTTLAGCNGGVPGATFASIGCRLDALLAHVHAEPALGTYAPKLVLNVEKARARRLDAESLCRASNLRKTKKRLTLALKALASYRHRLNGISARKKLDAAVRQLFTDEGTPIQQDLKALRGAVRCPDDAART